MRDGLKNVLTIWLCMVIFIASLLIVANRQLIDGTIYNNLLVSISTESPSYNIGDNIKMELYVKQLWHSETYTFTSSQRYDFEIYKNGTLIWHWSDGRGFATVMGYMTLSQIYPSKTYYNYWDSTGAEPGIYELKGIWTCSDPLNNPYDWTQFELLEI